MKWLSKYFEYPYIGKFTNKELRNLSWFLCAPLLIIIVLGAWHKQETSVKWVVAILCSIGVFIEVKTHNK